MKINKEELRQALIEVRDEEMNSFINACENEDWDQRIEASQKRVSQEKIHKLTQKREKWYQKNLSKVAVVFLLVALVGATSVYAIEKIRKAVVEWDTNLGKNEDDFHFNADNPAKTASPKEKKEIPKRIERKYHLTYIAEGFQKYGEDWQEQSYRIIYTKKKERIYFEQMTKTEKTTADLSLTAEKSIDINGYEGQMGNRGKEKVLKFVTEQYVFQLTTKATVDWDEMLQMAKSVAVMPPDQIETYYRPTYIPDGYLDWKDGYLKESWVYQLYYAKNKNQFIMYSQTTLEGTTSIDSEGAKRKEVDINGWKGQLNYKKKKKTIIWATNEYAYVVSGVGNISAEELLKVAKSITSGE